MRYSFIKAPKITPMSFNPDNAVERTMLQTVELDMELTLTDKTNIDTLMQTIYRYIDKNYEDPKNLLLGRSMYTSALKFMFNQTNGGLSFDFFMNYPMTLVPTLKPQTIIVMGKDNQTTFIDMLAKEKYGED